MNRSEKEQQALALDLFMRALEQPTAVRDQWLERNIGDDEAVRLAVRRLQTADAADTEFLNQKPDPNENAVGQLIGHWHLIENIATGGMGHVYLVERNDEGFRQRGALKIIRHQYLNANSELHAELLRRFHIERQILANINHPNVAAILDGGSTENGLPYLVMEYVQGESIDKFVEQQQLSLRQRLKLFQDLLNALTVVHANLVVHRDIKPSNILVDTTGQLKLLDFGIAKVLEPQPGIDSAQTATSASAMTPDYASPEQVLGEPITVATDIYALGLLLYRLLTGIPAYTVSSLPVAEAHKLVCTTDPKPPSKATTDQMQAAFINSKELVGDLDAIVMKAMRKEPELRYGSAAEFHHDIVRFLEGQPVLAHRDSLRYRTGKFWQRNKLIVSSAATIFLALTIGMSVAIWQASAAQVSAILAQSEADKANAVTEFLQDVLSQADPLEANDNPTVRQALDNADENIGERFADNPEVEAAVRRTLGWTQLNLGQVTRAKSNLNLAYQMNLDFYGPENNNTIKSLSDLGWWAHEANEHDLAKRYYNQAIANFNDGTSPVLQATVHNDFGVVLNYLDETEPAAEQYQNARLLWEDIPPHTKGYDLGVTIGNLAANYHSAGQLLDAETYYLRYLAMSESGEDPSQSNRFYALNNYSALLRETQRKAESLPMLEQATKMRTEILGAEHPTVARAHNNLAMLYIEFGDLEKASISRAIADNIAMNLPADHDTVLRGRIGSSMFQAAIGQLVRALSTINDLLAYLKTLSDGKYLEVTAQAKLHAGELLAKSGDTASGLVLMRQAIDHREQHYGKDHYLSVDARKRTQLVDELIF